MRRLALCKTAHHLKSSHDNSKCLSMFLNSHDSGLMSFLRMAKLICYCVSAFVRYLWLCLKSRSGVSLNPVGLVLALPQQTLEVMQWFRCLLRLKSWVVSPTAVCWSPSIAFVSYNSPKSVSFRHFWLLSTAHLRLQSTEAVGLQSFAPLQSLNIWLWLADVL